MMSLRARCSTAIRHDEDADSAREIVGFLFRRMPHYSAFHRLSRGQTIVLFVLVSVFAFAVTIAPRTSASLVVAFLAFVFLASFAYKAVLFFLGLKATDDPTRPCLEDHELPVYTVLVPLYRESAVIPALLRALDALDYPPSRLDIKLIVERDDAQTADALSRIRLAPHYSILRAPPIGPRTKPKALSLGLAAARGAYVVVYDAEDQPEPDQLRRALDRFAALGERTACLQARLNFFNARENWLTRLFAIDYCLWFDALLPGLERLGAPLPLGGTSNHFRRNTLVGVGGWDPYNVTEDADLGFRMAREGYRVHTLDSTTYEEAPTRFAPWLAQRTRWIKGYLQTYFVHMRAPRRLLAQTGWRGVIALHVFLLGTALAGLTGPVLWALFGFWVVTGSGLLSGFTGGALLLMSMFGLVVGNALLVFLSLLAPLRRRWLFLVPYALSVPVYWLMVSLAAWCALFEFVFRPFYWAKTPHGLTEYPADTRPARESGR